MQVRTVWMYSNVHTLKDTDEASVMYISLTLISLSIFFTHFTINGGKKDVL